MPNDPYRITSFDELRKRIGEPNPVTPHKVFDALDEQMSAYVARAPFCLLATSDVDGNLEISPKGDGPGFVIAEDSRTLIVPDRKGNKLLFGMRNILANPHVALIFMIPGTGETLRVSGRAELSVDPALLERLSARGQPALVAIRIAIDHCFFHCPRAFLRAELWKPESWLEPLRISMGRQLAPRIGGDATLAEQIDARLAKGRADL
jgi:PPOX class probable FMN-dependent enzyme